MHRQVSANAMPQTMIKILPRHPKRQTPEHFNIPPGQPARPPQTAHGDHARQHPRKGAAGILIGAADGNGAGNIRGPIKVLTATVEHQKMSVLQQAVGFLIHPVMDDRPMRPAARDRLKADVA